MGLLVDGEWRDVWYDTASTGGAFKRADASFRQRVTRDGSSGHPAAAGRYHLYVSFACPWAHRTLIVRALKGLEAAISVSVVDPLMLEHGWEFSDGPGCVPDPIFGAARLYEIYQRAKPDYTGRVTVPVLWDRITGTIVSNESSEILRMLDTEFDAFAEKELPTLYPPDRRVEIDALNQRIYDTVNNGVYKAGFATDQAVYEAAVRELFETLDHLEARLKSRRFLCGDRITEADWRLFTTLVRFDAVYHGHFKCNLRRLVDLPELWSYARSLFSEPGVAGTVHFDHIKRHYYGSHRTINPTGIVPLGPNVTWA
jgi:putative glutathione S-transferase